MSVEPYRSRLLLPRVLPFTDARERRWWYTYRSAGPPRVIFADDFDRADSATTLGSPWTAITGTWGIASGQAYNVSPVEAQNIVVVDAGESDVVIDCRMAALGSGSPGLYFRVVDGDNNWRLTRSGGSVLSLKRRVAGSLSTIGPLPAYTGTSGDAWRVVAKGSSIRCYVNGTLMIDVDDGAFATATKHGIGTATVSGDARWDDFRVTA